ncbi:hypothetical protein BK133_28880 [Paenibacillus sp. FSL H8-0548]|uniref:hypothetical protein n=1 Tax=Paenibacillus sp. FSL H8-0548 TaxID=1920422 RepID=UPI00096CB1EC|nr:hypothetical protein [Paenibacillus sp. FSL H8-0548]OMF21092.1 hypothetical protein BK133_28880 [Paenibacillus sp. FSL H8-0548]
MKGFLEAHSAFIQYHLDRRSGERRGRLERGHQHAEELFAKNIWWPMKGHFDHLHPEYEVLDWRGRPYFADYLIMPESWRILIEIKGFGEHVTNMDRKKYCNELNRETFLKGMGFHVISFAYDDVAHRPELCIYLLRTVLSRFESVNSKVERVYFADQEIIRFAIFLARPIRPIDISRHFSIDHRTALGHLQRLCKKGWLLPIYHGTGQRVLYYELTRQGLDSGLW